MLANQSPLRWSTYTGSIEGEEDEGLIMLEIHCVVAYGAHSCEKLISAGTQNRRFDNSIAHPNHPAKNTNILLRPINNY